MFKKTLLATASVVVATCGAITAAQAGQLKVRLHDVNLSDPYSDRSKHFDRNYDGPYDINGSPGPAAGNPNIPTGDRSIDKGFRVEKKTVGSSVIDFAHVVIADERVITPETPASGLYEIDLFEVAGLATFTEQMRIDIRLLGDADPMWKEDLNCAAVLRPGSDNVHSVSAAATADPDGGIQEGLTTASCFVTTTTTTTGVVGDSALGFALPINSKACGDLIVEITATRLFVDGSTSVDTSSHIIQECEDSLKADSGFYPVKIDYFADFRSFLIDPDPHDDKDVHIARLWAETGAIKFDIHHFLTDLKEANKESEENVFDVTDIEAYRLTVAFEDLTGIETVKLGGMPADVIDRVENTVSWSFDQNDLRSKFCLDYWDGTKGSKDEGCYVWFSVHAYGPKSGNPNNGPIDHQDAFIVVSEFVLTDGENNNVHPVPFFEVEEELVGAKVAQLDKTGIIFGPFDWVADASLPVQSWFRMTGVPEDHKDNLKGSITVENASAGKEFNGEYKVDFTPFVNNHEVLLGMNAIGNALSDAGMPGAAAFGRADLTFTFFVPGREGKKMDMDRLLWTNGVFADYGDNGNDGNSLKARSCDDGRFGSHVANKLKPGVEHLLVEICSLGELSRRGIFRN